MPFNHTDLPLLPTFSDFPALRKVGELYCDRSVQIAELAARKPGLFYLGRPRMFGRTFLLTTLKALFKEGAAVFEGLAGEGLWHEKPCEVVEIQHMSLCEHFSSDEDFRKRLQSYILLTFEPYGFNRQDDVGSRSFWYAFGRWLERQAPQSTVLLIDDFEFPFIDTADSHGFRSEIASEYSAFFDCLREHDDRLRFLMMTGTTRCITTGFDWVFRWLTDITFDADTSDIVGFTRKDLETTFLPWVQRAAQTTGLTTVDVMDRLEAWYGGWRFSFEEKPPVLCPWMVNSYLRDPHERVEVDWQCYGRQRTVVLKFRDAWLERNMLTLTDTIRLTKKELTEHKTDRDFRIELLMAQAGFYTIKSVDRDRMVTLTSPNAEGRRAMLASRAHRLLGRTTFAGWARAEDVPADPLDAADYFSMLMNGISRQRFFGD